MFQNAVLALTERMLFFRYGTPSHIFPFIAIVGERGALVTRARWESTYLSHAKRKPKTEGIFMEVAITETKQESWVFRGGGPGGNYIVGNPGGFSPCARRGHVLTFSTVIHVKGERGEMDKIGIRMIATLRSFELRNGPDVASFNGHALTATRMARRSSVVFSTRGCNCVCWLPS